jgi:UDP-N-acetylglucosamine diphosphorylase / glucose-1-phosphate thymidylyltransferase / UDP-N-acetylgalactosamine diphosphorylase / glucosamine-1-phosphate N-acetyltransferase / galactosamine-1-phosphate N-acetyltransferase
MIKQAVILAAGEGQRLRPFTVTKPKTMISIAGKPILQYVVESLARNGVRKIIIVAGYRREQVFNYMATGEKFGVSINYVIQEKQLGTAHALMQVRDFVDNEFLVLPGDNLIEAGTIAKFVSAEPHSILVKTVENNARYGVTATDDRNNVISIEEKPREAERDIINTGIYALNKEIFEHIDNQLGIPDVINNMIAMGHVFCARETDGMWLDVVYPWDILGLNNAILRRIQPSLAGTIEAGASIRGMVSIGKNTVVHSNSYIHGPVVIGDNCEIGPHACILPATSIGDNVVISPFCSIENSVISKDVNIGPGAIIEDSVIDESCVIQGRFTASSDEVELRINDESHKVKVGAMLGVGCNLKNNVIAQPGVIIGNYCQSQAMKLLNGKIPDRSIIY